MIAALLFIAFLISTTAGLCVVEKILSLYLRGYFKKKNDDGEELGDESEEEEYQSHIIEEQPTEEIKTKKKRKLKLGKIGKLKMKKGKKVANNNEDRDAEVVVEDVEELTDGTDDILVEESASLILPRTIREPEECKGVYKNESQALKQIQMTGFTNTFCSKAKIVVILEIKPNGALFGSIQEVKGLDTKNKKSPKQMRFHMKFHPSGKKRVVTKWHPAKNGNVLTTFCICTLPENVRQTESLFVGVYGRRNPIEKSKCFGQVYLALAHVGEKPKSFAKKILPYTKRTLPFGVCEGGEAAQSSLSETEDGGHEDDSCEEMARQMAGSAQMDITALDTENQDAPADDEGTKKAKFKMKLKKRKSNKEEEDVVVTEEPENVD